LAERNGYDKIVKLIEDEVLPDLEDEEEGKWHVQ